MRSYLSYRNKVPSVKHYCFKQTLTKESNRSSICNRHAAVFLTASSGENSNLIFQNNLHKNKHIAFAGHLNIAANGLNTAAGSLNICSDGLNIHSSGLNIISNGSNISSGSLNIIPIVLNIASNGLNIVSNGINIVFNRINALFKKLYHQKNKENKLFDLLNSFPGEENKIEIVLRIVNK